MYATRLPDPSKNDDKALDTNAVIYARATSRYAYPRHTTPYLLVANYENPGDYILNDRHIRAGGSWFYFLSPGDELEISFDGKTPTRPLIIQFTTAFVDRTGSLPIPPVPFHAGPGMQAQLNRIRELSVHYQPDIDDALLDLLTEFQPLNLATLRKIDSLDAVKRDTRQEIYSRLTVALQYMQENLHLPLTLEELSREARMSVFHFLKCFKALYHTTPHRHLQRLRLDRASSLLRSGNLTVSEVCNATGFESHASFSLLFKKTFGLSPSRAKKEHR